MTLPLLFAALLALPAQTRDDPVLDQARALRRAERTDEAITLLSQAPARRAGDPEVLGLLGTLLLEAGRLADAEAVATELLGREGESYRAFVFAGQLGLAHGDHERALEAFRRAGKLKERPIDALAGQVEALLLLSREGQAVKRAEDLTALHPDTGRPLLARALVAQGNAIMLQSVELYGLAAERFERALAAQPDDRAILERLLEVLVVTLRIEEARPLVEGSLAAPADALERHYWLGRCDEAARDYAAAREQYRAALGDPPVHGPSALQLAKLAVADGQTSQARQWLALANELLGESTRTLALQAEVHTDLGELEQAEALLRRLLARSPRDAPATYQLARLLYRQAKKPEGDAMLARFRELQLATRPDVKDG